MKRPSPFFELWLWGTVVLVIGVVVSLVVITNTTVRSIEKNLPKILLEELYDLDQVLQDLSEVASAAEVARLDPSLKNFDRLHKKVEKVSQAVVRLRNTYVFDNLIRASAFHAVAAPAIADLETWLSEGVSGYGPHSEITMEVILSRISNAYQKAKVLNEESHLAARRMLDEQRLRLDQFLSHVNLLFMLTLATTGLMVVLLIRQGMLKRREAKSQVALREQRDLLNGLFENLLIGITVWDREGRLLLANKGFGDLTGYTTEEVKSLADWFPRAYPDTEYRKQVLQDWEASAQSGSAVREFKVTCRDGGVKDIEFRAMFMPEGRSLVTLADVTPRKLAEEEKERLEDQLRQAQKMEAVGTLAGGIAHDFNNILSAVLGHAELARLNLGKGKDNSAQLNQIISSAKRARDLVKQILTFSRRSGTDMKTLDLNQVVIRSVQLLKPTIPKMVEIQMKLAGNLEPILADAIQMEQVIMNLASNASDSMPEGGRLVFETSQVHLGEDFCQQHLEMTPGEYVRLGVIDTGRGMDAETLNQVFDPFFTTKEVGRGTGLGLSTVYGIVKEHKGQVSCSSAPGQGTTIMIYLPVHRALPAGAEKKGPGMREAPGGQETLLLVDDERAIREFGAEILEDAGYRVLTAASGEEALVVYEETRRDAELVILDLGMPGMGGRKCLEEFLALNPELKVLIVSGYAADGGVRDAMKDGAAGFMPKPFTRRDLLKTIRGILDA